MQLGKLGMWSHVDHLDAEGVVAFARQSEAWGYSTFWVPEAVGRDPFSLIGFLAAKTERIVLATGIANIYARDPMLMKAIWKTVSGLAPDRFILGLGVSHRHLVTNQRGHAYEKPVETMRGYLEAMDKALYLGPQPSVDAPIVIGALRDRMLSLSATMAQGAHPYNVTPEHTQRARTVMGPKALLLPEQMVLAETDPEKARTVARAQLEIYLKLPNYQNNLRQFGFVDADFENDGSDRIVDALVCWGTPEKIARHVEAHLAAGANHVCIQAFRPDGKPGADEALLEALPRLVR